VCCQTTLARFIAAPPYDKGSNTLAKGGVAINGYHVLRRAKAATELGTVALALGRFFPGQGAGRAHPFLFESVSQFISLCTVC